MPTYDYICRDCGYAFEEFQNMSDEPLSNCPKCGGTVKRMIGGGIGIIFKGSGFYVTDNRTDSKSGDTASAADSPKKQTADTAASADSASVKKNTPATPDKKSAGIKDT